MPVQRLMPLFLLVGVFDLLISSCASPDRSKELFEKAEQASQQQLYQQAKRYLDSINLLYPNDPVLLKKTRYAMYKVELAEQQRTRTFCDSLLCVRQAEFPSKQKNFCFQSDHSTEGRGWYVSLHQTHNKRLQHTYLQTKVNERGQLIITSYYCGSSALNHSRFRIYAPDGSFCESLEVKPDGALNYQFRDGSHYYEIVRFNEKAINDMIDFITMHTDTELRVELMGTRNHRYRMDKTDQAVISNACELSATLSEITRLLEEIRLAQAKINYLTQKLNQHSN